MDWFTFSKDWRELYRLKQRLGVGSALHSAMSNDPDVAQQIADYQRANRGVKSKYPAAEGFDALMHKLTDVEDRLIVVAHSFGGDGSGIQWTPRPRFLSDDIADYESKKKSRKLQAMLVPHDNIQLLD